MILADEDEAQCTKATRGAMHCRSTFGKYGFYELLEILRFHILNFNLSIFSNKCRSIDLTTLLQSVMEVEMIFQNRNLHQFSIMADMTAQPCQTYQ